MFFGKQLFELPLLNSIPPLHQAMGNDYGRRINKMVLPHPSPSPSSLQQMKFPAESACALLDVNKVKIPMRH